jgi:hypothetical protein
MSACDRIANLYTGERVELVYFLPRCQVWRQVSHHKGHKYSEGQCHRPYKHCSARGGENYTEHSSKAWGLGINRTRTLATNFLVEWPVIMHLIQKIPSSVISSEIVSWLRYLMIFLDLKPDQGRFLSHLSNFNIHSYFPTRIEVGKVLFGGAVYVTLLC